MDGMKFANAAGINPHDIASSEAVALHAITKDDVINEIKAKYAGANPIVMLFVQWLIQAVEAAGPIILQILISKFDITPKPPAPTA